MAKLPYMRVYVPDLISDTYTLSDAEFGAYTRIVYALWRFKGSLAFDHVELAKIAGTTTKNWPKRWAKIERYFIVENGRISQSRVTDELRQATKSAPAKPVDDLLGESNRPRKPLENNNPISPSGLSQNPEPELEPESKSSTVVLFPLAQQAAPLDDWPSCPPTKLLDVLAQRADHPWLDPSKDVTMALHKSAATYFARWRDAGCSWETDVLPQVTALCVRAGRPVANLKFFDGAILDAQRARTAPIYTTPPRMETRRDREFASRQENFADSRSAGEWLDAFNEDAARARGLPD